jgi:Family of unknown function (DUF5906)
MAPRFGRLRSLRSLPKVALALIVSANGHVATARRDVPSTAAAHLARTVRRREANGKTRHELVGNFNAHLRDCVMLFADEAFFAGDRQHESVLKALITDPVLPIEGKHQNLVNVPNMLHVGIASNADWVVPATHDERRYFVLNASDARIDDRKYFADIASQMDNGGLAAMIDEMLHRDISRFDVRDVPKRPGPQHSCH